VPLPTSGRVAEVPFARVVGSLALRRLTGALRLEQDGRKYALFFQEGAIADADSSAPEDTLGRVALEAGLVDSSAVGDSLRRMAQSPTKTQKDIFVETGALKGEALDRVLRLTLTRRALRIFALPGASFAVEVFDHGRLDGGPVEPRWSLYRGLRTHYDERRLDLEMSPALAGQAFKLTIDPTDIYEAYGFGNDELVLLKYLAKRHYWELGDLVDACMTLPRSTVLAVVHALHSFENLDVRARGTVQRYRKQARQSTLELNRSTLDFELKAPGTNPGVPPQGVRFTPPTGAPIDNVRPIMDDGAITDVNPPVEPARPRAAGTNPPLGSFARPGTPPAGEAALPSPTATPTPAPARPSGTSPPTTPPRHSGPMPPVSRPLSGPAPAVVSPAGTRVATTPPRGSAATPPTTPPAPTKRSGPAAAFGAGQRVVTEPGTTPPRMPGGARSSDGALQALKAQIAAKFAAVEANVDHYALLGLDRGAAPELIKQTYFALVMVYHPDRLDPRLEPMRAQVQRIFSRLTDAHNVLSDENKRREYLSILAQGGEAAAKRRADEAAAEAGRAITADEHFKKGQMALRRQQFPAAVEEFQAAVELYDGEAEYFAHLAWAKWNAAGDKTAVQAEVKGHFNRALQLNSRCIDALYFRGQMYSALGEIDKAARHFQQVLSYNEDHVEAAREIRLIEMRKKSGKGLFDRFRKK